MAQSISKQSNPIDAVNIHETSCNHNGNLDVRGGATTVHTIQVDNTANASASYLKCYDAAAPVIGTTAPDFIFKVPASVKKVFNLDFAGIAFTNFSFACVTAGGTAGVTDPGSAVVVDVLCT